MVRFGYCWRGGWNEVDEWVEMSEAGERGEIEIEKGGVYLSKFRQREINLSFFARNRREYGKRLMGYTIL